MALDGLQRIANNVSNFGSAFNSKCYEEGKRTWRGEVIKFHSAVMGDYAQDVSACR
jgi:hypothetical protein